MGMEIDVFADWEEFDKPTLVGTLSRHTAIVCHQRQRAF